ncbi:MAG: glycosyltransferase family 2 protein [Steroidobacteraceae bacterium]
MRVGLIITTYEWPRALASVLRSVRAQRRPPNELIIADDGSGIDTRLEVAAFARQVHYPVHYVRQEHQGFRLARLRNLALATAHAEYLVFIDGDMVLHPEFLADHCRAARPDFYLQGARIPLDKEATQAVIQGASPPGVFGRGAIGRRRLHAIHSPILQPLLGGLGRRILAIKGCNQGFWRQDLLKINGYDEAFTGWGSEDKDLCWRLELAGVQRQGLLAGGIAYHLNHPPAARDQAAINLQRFRETQKKRRMRCACGVDRHC